MPPLSLRYRVVQQLPILRRLPSLSAPCQLPDLAFISKGQHFGQRSLQSWLQERDMPDVAPNELHEDPVVSFGVADHAGSLGKDKAKVINSVRP
jgi:hypothetical protein